MTATTITAGELSENSVSALPTRPTAPHSFGGLGYTSTEMKAAFDALPLLIADRFNKLLADVGRTDEDALAAAIPTGNANLATLADLFAGIESGALVNNMKLEGNAVGTILSDLLARVTRMENIFGL